MKVLSVARWGFVVITLCGMLGWSDLRASSFGCPPEEQGCSLPEEAQFCGRTAQLICGFPSSCCYGVCDGPQYPSNDCDNDGNQCYCILVQ